MTTYLACSKKYEYKYIKQFPSITKMSMASGSAMHETLEYNARHKLSHDADMSMEQIVDTQVTAHDKFMPTTEDYDKKKADKDKDGSIATVKLYRRTQAPFIQPIVAEFPFTIDIAEDEHQEYLPVIGYIDSASQYPDPRDGPTKGQPIIALEDYKKVTQKKSQMEVDVSPQLTLYDYVYNLNTGLTTDVVGFRQLGFNGPRANEPGPFSVPLYRSPDMMVPEKRQRRWERIMDQIKAVQRAIKAGVFIATDDARVCSWCDYNIICQDSKVR